MSTTSSDNNSERVFTLEELRQYDGSDVTRPVYVAVCGTVFDVSEKRDVYGKGGSYNVLAGREASRCLALSSLKAEDNEPEGNTDGLTEAQMNTLKKWEEFYQKKYPVVGRVQL